jgi:hypothetical protein
MTRLFLLRCGISRILVGANGILVDAEHLGDAAVRHLGLQFLDAVADGAPALGR